MDAPDRIAIVSGYFNPIHIGHLRLIKAARELAPHLVPNVMLRLDVLNPVGEQLVRVFAAMRQAERNPCEIAQESGR